MCIVHIMCIYILYYTVYIYIHIICILICAGCRNNAFQPAGFADACIIGPKITVNFVWYLGYDSSQQRPEKCMLPRKKRPRRLWLDPTVGMVLITCSWWVWTWGIPQWIFIGVGICWFTSGFRVFPEFPVCRMRTWSSYRVYISITSGMVINIPINSFSLPDLHTDLF